MTTTEFLQREIRRTELSIRRAERKPNTPAEELRGLHEKLDHLQDALKAVEEHWQRVHEQRGWTAAADVRPVVRGRWLHETEIEGHACGECSACHKIRVIDNFCPNCGADMRGGTEQ